MKKIMLIIALCLVGAPLLEARGGGGGGHAGGGGFHGGGGYHGGGRGGYGHGGYGRRGYGYGGYGAGFGVGLGLGLAADDAMMDASYYGDDYDYPPEQEVEPVNVQNSVNVTVDNEEGE